MQSILAILGGLSGLAATAITLIMLVACAPNSSPAQGAGLKALAVGTVGVGAACLVGWAAGLVIARHGVSLFIGMIPWIWGALAIFLIMLLDRDRVDPDGGSWMARSIALAIFTPLAVMLLLVGVREMSRQAWMIRTAEPVPAVVMESGVIASKSWDSDRTLRRDVSTTTYEPVVRFAYQSGGRSYESTLIKPTIIVQTYASRETAAEIIAAYPAGLAVTAFVPASMPQLGFLQRSASVAPLIFVTLGIGLVPAVWSLVRVLI